MKIAYVTPRYAPDIGGVETHVAEIATRVAAAGHGVEVITQTRRADLPLVESRDGVLIRRFGLPPLGRSADFAPGLWRHLSRFAGQFDVIHAHNYHSPPALAAAMVQRQPLVFTPHYHAIGTRPVIRWLHGPYRIPGSLIFRRSRRVVCVSEVERDLVLQRFPGTADRIVVIPNGVDVESLRKARPFPDEGRSVVLSVGRLKHYKRMDRVIEAMRHLDARFTLTVVGEGPVRAPLERLINEEGLDDRVHLMGGITGPDLARWYRTASVFALLSEHESFSITPREALAAGANVVLSEIPAHREIERAAGEARVALVPIEAGAADVAAAMERMAAISAMERPVYSPPSWDEVAAWTLGLYGEATTPDEISTN